MEFDPAAYGPEAASILALAGNGHRPMPLISPRRNDPSVAANLKRPARELFPDAAKPDAAHAGLWLYCGFFDESHEVAQEIHTADGSFWHGILHRMEPDAWNAGYWFRRVGSHPVFPRIRAAAMEQGYETGSQWDPSAFVDACTEARPGSPRAALLERVQLAEWQILFDYCARGK